MVTIDFSPRVEPDEAANLMLHHLAIALAYFEATDDPIPQDIFDCYGDGVRAAALGFVNAADKYYKDIEV